MHSNAYKSTYACVPCSIFPASCGAARCVCNALCFVRIAKRLVRARIRHFGLDRDTDVSSILPE